MSSKVGGRVSTRTEGGYIWDTGATSIAPRGKQIEQVIQHELDTTGLVKIEKPIYLHEGLRIRPGHSPGAIRYTYTDGNVTLATRLADGLDVRLSQQIEEIERQGSGYRLLEEEFDALILTPPVPQIAMLLWPLGESRPMANVHYRPCLSVLLGYRTTLPATPYHALLDVEQVHPMTWLCLESAKSPGRAPEGQTAMVAQMSAAYSHTHFDQEDQAIVQSVAGYVARLYGSEFASPTSHNVIRWKYSQPESYASFEHVNRNGAKLMVASDGLLGGHVEDAYEIGTRTAELLVEED